MHARRWFSRLSRPVLSRLVLRGLIVPALVAAGALAAAAQDTPPDDRPFHLDLDTGGHRAFIKDITFSPDGEYLLTASDDKTIRIWDWRSGVTVRTLRGFVGDDNDGKVFALAISPDGKTVAAGGYFGPGIGQSPPYGNIRLFDFGTGRMLDVLKAPQLTVYDVQFSPDGSLLAAAGQDGLAYLWQRDGDGWKEAGTLDAESNRIEKIAFVLGGKRLAAVTTDYGIRLWDVASGQRIDMADAQPLDDISVTALAATPDGARFATGTVGGVIQVWDAASGSLTQTLPSLGFQIGALTFAGPD
ncbi:MAG: WD40 repeat domain-containing protein, partial [Rhizobiaceae bacterium]